MSLPQLPDPSYRSFHSGGYGQDALGMDPMMEQEIEEIRQKYQSKRQPILDAIEAKKRRQQNF